MKVTLKHLEILHSVVVSGNISKACKSLSLAQPTISQQLAKMEDILGTQLIRRERTKKFELTLAGEFWFRTAQEVLDKLESAQATHNCHFNGMKIDLRFGTTPSLRGLFLQEVSDIAIGIGKISKVEFVWALTSDEVVELINSHRINCGVVSEAAAEPFASSLHIQELFDDEVVWVVPRTIPDRIVEQILKKKDIADRAYEAINRYVDVSSGIPWHSYSINWFRSKLPNSIPFFTCMTHQGAVDIVAGGKATCHAPVSLLPNLPLEVLSRIKCYRSDIYLRKAVLVMPKHLLSLKPFADLANQITSYFSENYYINVTLEDLPNTALQVTSKQYV